MIAVLSALEQIGDTRALPHVQHLLDTPHSTPDAQRVHEAAQSCLVFLEERAAKERVGQSLLRAAHAPDTGAGVLLRPAQNTPESDPALLLRPGSEGGDEP